MGAFLTAIVWVMLILGMTILSITCFIGYVGLSALTKYVDDMVDDPNWFDKERFGFYYKETFEELFK